MKLLKTVMAFALVVLMAGLGYAADVSDEDSSSKDSGGGMSSALTGTLLGGLLGGGIGTAIGSASGKAGTGALIGAGVGAAGGALLGASQDDKKARDAYYQRQKPPAADTSIPKGAKVKKKIIRQYDEKGNLISEEEIE